MKRVTAVTRMVLFMSVILLTACASEAKNKNKKTVTPTKVERASAYGDVIAGPGQSEVVIENTLNVPIRVFLGGQVAGTVRARSAERIVVPDGNHYIKVQNTERGGGTSRDVQFYTQSRRFFFRATSPNNTSVSLTRDNAYEITPARAAAPTTVTPQGGPAVVDDSERPLAETALGKDKAAMFERLDAQVGGGSAPAAAPAPAPVAVPAPAPAAVSAAPSPAPQAAPAAAQRNAVRPQIAVYVTGDKSDGERKALGTKMLVALVNSGRYVAVERSDEFTAKIDEEHMKQRGGSVDDAQISNLGKQFGVRYVCVATITEAFGAFQVSARIIDVETAVVVAIGEDSSQLRNMDDLDSVSFRIVRAMLK